MLNCRQVTRLVSKSMDGRLRWHQRLAVRIHFLYCVWCRRYAGQIQLLRKAARGLGHETEVSPSKLSEDAKEKIQKRLEGALKNPLPPSA